MNKLSVFLLLLLSLPVFGANKQMLTTRFGGDLKQYLCAPDDFRPVPRSGDAYWRDSIPQTMRQSYISYGETYLGKPWQSLQASVFAQFKKTGNRVNYEQQCFEKRRHLAALVMAEVMEDKGRFVGDIVDGLQSMCEETWWGIPAHYGHPVPMPDEQTVDLFNAETAGLMAWTEYMLRDKLDAFSPDICRRIDSEMNRRILRPALEHDYWWKKAGMNWNPWICSNWLTCVLMCEKDRDRQIAAVEQISKSLDTFIDAYHDDGGCDEGPGYWDRASASLFDCLYLLKTATQGKVTLAAEPKIKAMGAYVYKTYIGNDYCVTFADTHDNKTLQQVDVLYPFGEYLGDPLMKEFAAYLAKRKNLKGDAATLYAKSGNFPALGRELVMLGGVNRLLNEKANEPLLKNSWLPDLQIMTARRKAGSVSGLFVAAKGGSNGESHNHNDVGNFVVYGDGEPLLVDVGVGEYTSKTFGKDRYSIWTMQSAYHNLPQINGYDQHDGKQYAASDAVYHPAKLQLNIAGAYPQEAAVKSWRRTVSLTAGGEVAVTENYQLAQYLCPSRLMFITCQQPDVSAAGKIILGKWQLTYDFRKASVAVEPLDTLLDPLLKSVWGPKMFRIVMTLKSSSLQDKFSYQIGEKH